MNKNNFIAVHTEIENVDDTLRVIKGEKIWQFDENTYARLNDFKFHNVL